MVDILIFSFASIYIRAMSFEMLLCINTHLYICSKWSIISYRSKGLEILPLFVYIFLISLSTPYFLIFVFFSGSYLCITQMAIHSNGCFRDDVVHMSWESWHLILDVCLWCLCVKQKIFSFHGCIWAVGICIFIKKLRMTWQI